MVVPWGMSLNPNPRQIMAPEASEEEMCHLVGRRRNRSYTTAADKDEEASLARRLFGWLSPLASATSTPLPLPDLDSLPVDRPLDALQFKMISGQEFRYLQPGPVEQLARNNQLVMKCLDFYNSKHPDDQYEPAAGVVTRYNGFDNGLCWTHGNFVARRKCSSGCLPCLPAPRTIFFFELVIGDDDISKVVTCTPLDEPVTEAYNLLGFTLGCGTRRNGKWDSICKTCYTRVDVPHPDMRKKFPCGHDKVEEVCKMCYFRSDVLHPSPGEFAYG